MISRTEFEQGIRASNLRVSQIIHLALMAGVMFFFAIVVVLYLTGTPKGEPDEDLARMLCLALFVLAVSAYGAAFFLYRKMFAAISVSDSVATPSGMMEKTGDIFLYKLRIPQIMRLALFEGVAFFGLVICLLSVMDGLLQVRPIYWAAALPTLFLVLLAAMTFPTMERVAALFESYQEMIQSR